MANGQFILRDGSVDHAAAILQSPKKQLTALYVKSDDNIYHDHISTQVTDTQLTALVLKPSLRRLRKQWRERKINTAVNRLHEQLEEKSP